VIRTASAKTLHSAAADRPILVVFAAGTARLRTKSPRRYDITPPFSLPPRSWKCLMILSINITSRHHALSSVLRYAGGECGVSGDARAWR